MTTDNILAPVAALTLPDAVFLTSRAQGALAFIQSFEVATAEDYGLAAEELQAVKARSKKLEEQRTAITGPINAALKAVNDLFRQPAQILGQAESMIKSKLLAFDQEQQRLAAEQRRKAEETAAAARKLLEEQAAAHQREVDAQAKAAEAARAAGDAQAAAFAQANMERAQAESQAATTTALMVTAAPPTAAPVKAKGLSTSTKVDYEVVNLLALVQHVAAHPELINLLAADSVKLRAYVKGVGISCQLPGVRVFEDRVMSARAA